MSDLLVGKYEVVVKLLEENMKWSKHVNVLCTRLLNNYAVMKKA